MLRIAELIRRELLLVLQSNARDPRLAQLVITHVQVFPDLATARVYVALRDGPHSQREIMSGLHHAAGFLRSSLSARLQLRMTPKLYFVDEARRHRDPRELRNEDLLAQTPGPDKP